MVNERTNKVLASAGTEGLGYAGLSHPVKLTERGRMAEWSGPDH